MPTEQAEHTQSTEQVSKNMGQHSFMEQCTLNAVDFSRADPGGGWWWFISRGNSAVQAISLLRSSSCVQQIHSAEAFWRATIFAPQPKSTSLPRLPGGGSGLSMTALILTNTNLLNKHKKQGWYLMQEIQTKSGCVETKQKYRNGEKVKSV